MYSLADACKTTESQCKPPVHSKILDIGPNGEPYPEHPLPVGLGNTLELVLLLNGVAVGRSLGGVDKLL